MSTERERLELLLVRLHGILMVVLIALRPLVWDGDAASPANIVYLAIIQLALLITAAELATGVRALVRWSWLGLLFAGLVLAVIPAAFHAPIPAEGSAFFWQLVLHLGLGAYLMQVVPGRARLAWSALLAGLLTEVAISWIQGLYVLPKMTGGTLGGDAAVAAEGIAASDLLERVKNGGWFGTFTLSNTLAAWLLLTLIPAVGMAYQALKLALKEASVPRLSSVFMMSAVVAGAGVLLATRSKGAYIAVAGAGALWWMVYQRGWWRWLPLPAAGLAILLAMQVPAISAGLAASARVRWGYWSGAVALVREAPIFGHGVGAFAERSSGVLPLWAEPSRMVHNEPLEMAVVAGIPIAVLLIMLLLLAAWPRRSDREPMAEVDLTTLPQGSLALSLSLSLAMIFVTGYLCMLGMLDGNLGWWPGGGDLLGQGAWGIVVGVFLAVGVRLAWHTTSPPRWWLRLGVAAVALHSLIDFDLHSFAVIGTLLVVVICAGAHDAAGRTWRMPRAVGVLLFLMVVGMGAGWVSWVQQALDVRNAQDVVRALRLTRDAAHRDEGFEALAFKLGMPEPAAGDGRARTELVMQAVTTGISLSASDPTTTVQLLSTLPPSTERLTRLNALLVHLPYHLSLARLRAQDYLAAGRWNDAITEMRRGVALAPAYLPARQELEMLLGHVAERDTTHAQQWRDERTRVIAEREALESIVDYRNKSH